MRIVVGLGNPGPEYAGTRHNAGFMVVERLAARWRITLGRRARGLRVGQGRVAGASAMLVEPLGYMNRSGEALAQLELEWRAEDLIVIHDDMDLPAGQLRIRHDGGTGGHRGLESLAARWGRNFDRLRVGVGRPPDGVEAADYVLTRLTAAESEEFDATIERAADAAECVLAEGLERAMNRFNLRLLSEPG